MIPTTRIQGKPHSSRHSATKPRKRRSTQKRSHRRSRNKRSSYLSTPTTRKHGPKKPYHLRKRKLNKSASYRAKHKRQMRSAHREAKRIFAHQRRAGITQEAFVHNIRDAASRLPNKKTRMKIMGLLASFIQGASSLQRDHLTYYPGIETPMIVPVINNLRSGQRTNIETYLELDQGEVFLGLLPSPTDDKPAGEGVSWPVPDGYENTIYAVQEGNKIQFRINDHCANNVILQRMFKAVTSRDGQKWYQNFDYHIAKCLPQSTSSDDSSINRASDTWKNGFIALIALLILTVGSAFVYKCCSKGQKTNLPKKRKEKRRKKKRVTREERLRAKEKKKILEAKVKKRLRDERTTEELGRPERIRRRIAALSLDYQQSNPNRKNNPIKKNRADKAAEVLKEQLEKEANTKKRQNSKRTFLDTTQKGKKREKKRSENYKGRDEILANRALAQERRDEDRRVLALEKTRLRNEENKRLQVEKEMQSVMAERRSIRLNREAMQAEEKRMLAEAKLMERRHREYAQKLRKEREEKAQREQHNPYNLDAT